MQCILVDIATHNIAVTTVIKQPLIYLVVIPAVLPAIAIHVDV